MRDRLSVVADEVGSRRQLSKLTGIGESRLYRFLSGESIPNAEALLAIARGANISLDWLLTGEGNMRPQPSWAGTSIRSSEEISQFYLVPRFNVEAAAGGGSLIESEQIVDTLAFKMDWIRQTLKVAPADLVLISAVGDSMEPRIKSGDLLLINQSDQKIRDHAIYVLNFGGHLVVKRLQTRHDGTVLIISDNPVYKTEEIAPNEASSLRIVGRVVWVGTAV
jgi:phage repressor protein C with HTH and peptisase S24 domain